MKETRKIIVSICSIILLSIAAFGFYIYQSTENAISESRQLKHEYRYNGETFKIYYEDSVMAFGSGHKILALYDKAGKKVAEDMFGDHPLLIESVTDEAVKILIPITLHDKNMEGYIRDWCSGNKKIGRYKIEYRFFYDPAISTADLVYPED
jgi:hypothetical protein